MTNEVGLMRALEVPGYRVDAVVGRGATSRVWRAVRESDGRDVAIKVVEGCWTDGGLDGGAEPLRDTVARPLDDAFLVPVLDVISLRENRTAIVMELMQGGSLRDAVAARGRLTAGECVTVLVPIAGVLGRLHRRGIVHGDVSPDNILFDVDGRPHLADLGASHAVGDVARDVMGTDGFVAPEVLLGADPGPWSDVHALCALGWFALTGEEPDLAPVRPALRQILAGRSGADSRDATSVSLGIDAPVRPERGSSIPDALIAILEEGMTAQPEQRPAADDIAEAVFASARAEPLPVGIAGVATASLTRRLREAMQASTLDEPESGRRWWARAARSGRTRVRGRKHAAAARGRRPPAPDRPSRNWLAWGLCASFVAMAVWAVLVVVAPGHRLGDLWTPGMSSARAAEPEEERAAEPAETIDPDAELALSGLAAGADAEATEALQRLSDLRVQAWSDPASGPWAAMVVPDSPAALSDAQDREMLMDAGQHTEDLELRVRDAQWVTGGDAAEPATRIARARVDVSDHDVVSGTGRTSNNTAVAGELLEFELRWDGETWRLWEVRPVT